MVERVVRVAFVSGFQAGAGETLEPPYEVTPLVCRLRQFQTGRNMNKLQGFDMQKETNEI